MEGLKVHIRHVMLWEFKQGRNATETWKKICSVYGQGNITDRQVRNRFAKFHSGDMSLKNEPRPGRSSDFDIDALKSLVECNPQQSTRELANKLNTSQSTICRYLEKIKKRPALINRRTEMAQGKLKVKTKVPTSIKMKIHKTKKGPAIQRRGNAPVQPKKTKLQETQKLKKMITKNVNNVVENELRQKALEGRKTLTKKN